MVLTIPSEAYSTRFLNRPIIATVESSFAPTYPAPTATLRNLDMPLPLRSLSLVLNGCLLFIGQAFADEGWSRFRGDSGNGASGALNPPTTWSESSQIAWRSALPGAGASSPVLFGEHLYITSFVMPEQAGDPVTRVLSCINSKDGRIIWESPLPASHPTGELAGFVNLHGFASSTPAVDDSGVYVFYGSTGAVAFTHDGEHRWTTHLGEGLHTFGTANSPVIYEDMVIFNASVESGSLVALNKSNGAEVWRVDGVERSWNTPLIYRGLDGNPELTLSVQGKVKAFDPASGQQLWEATAIDDYICPSVIVQEGIVFASGGRARKLVAIQSGGRGDVTESHVLWTLDRGSNVSSPVFHEGYLYWANESQGIVYCADAKTGELVYEERLEPKPDRIYASPIIAAGMIYYVSRDSGTYVVAADPTFRLIAHNLIASDGSIFNGSPITIGERILLRSDTYLYCIGQ